MLNFYIFNHLTEDTAIAALLRYRKDLLEDDYFTFAKELITFSKSRYTDGDIIKEYVLRKMLEYPFLPDISNLRNFLRHDIKMIYNEILSFDWDNLFAENGLLPMKDITVPKIGCDIPGYASSVEAMMNCISNEALGGAILAHVESFSKEV